jgi:hypothetical protein
MLLEESMNKRAVSFDGRRRKPTLALQVCLVPKTQLVGRRALGDHGRCDHIDATQKLEKSVKASTRSVTTLASSLLEIASDEILVEICDAVPTGLQPATEIL